jgi:hypothetical protein
MPYLLLKPRVPPSASLRAGSPPFVTVDTTLMRIIGEHDLIRIGWLFTHRFQPDRVIAHERVHVIFVDNQDHLWGGPGQATPV